MKFEGVFESVGMKEWVVDARACSRSEAVERIISLYQRRDAVRLELKRNAELARQELTGIFEGLIEQGGAGSLPRLTETLPRFESSYADVLTRSN
jgi:hypothetical protein